MLYSVVSMKMILKTYFSVFYSHSKDSISSITMIIFLSDFLFPTHGSQQITAVEICEIKNHSEKLFSIAQQ